MAAEAAKVQEQWGNKLEEVEEAHENEMEPIAGKWLEKAEELVEKSGVGSAACDIIGMRGGWSVLSQASHGQPPIPVGPLEQGRTPIISTVAGKAIGLLGRGRGIPYRLELTVESITEARPD